MSDKKYRYPIVNLDVGYICNVCKKEWNWDCTCEECNHPKEFMKEFKDDLIDLYENKYKRFFKLSKIDVQSHKDTINMSMSIRIKGLE